MTRFKKIPGRVLILSTCLVFIARFFAGRFMSYASEKKAREDGSLVTFSLVPEDFTLSGIRAEDGGYMTTDNDPQMIYEKTMKVSKVRMEMEYSLEPGEIVMYYTNPGDAGFSPNKRVWGKPVGDSGYEFDLTLQEVSRIRIDPTMYPSNHLRFGRIMVNEEKTAADCFTVEAKDRFNLIVYTGIASSVLKFIQTLIPDRKEKSTVR